MILRVVAGLTVTLLAPRPASAWGFVAHRIIAENAVAALPAEMQRFYRANMTALSGASIEPDSVLRDREGEAESRRHFVNLDELARPPFKGFPADEATARRRFGDAQVDAAGTLPWRVVQIQEELSGAFRGRDWKRAVTLSGWLSHYVSDAHQPLHTTSNHDGQKTCNHGIHEAFETDLVDRLRADYRERTALPPAFRVEAVRDAGAFILSEIKRSHALVKEVLAADAEAVRAVKGRRHDYYEELEGRAGPIARRQMQRAAGSFASLCYTAWLEAGRPELPDAPAPRGKRSRATAGKP